VTTPEDAVLDLAYKYLKKVRKSGPDQIMAECPFHTSDDPGGSRTLSLNISRGLFFCFSCHAKGNLARFLRDIGEAPAVIKIRYGALIERLEEEQVPRHDPLRDNLLSNPTIPESLLGLFQWCPVELLEQGFEEEVLRYFDVGFDKTHMRVTYPLRDIHGRLVGVSGRRTEGEEGGRYKIYKEEYKIWGMPTVGTERKVLLWNLHQVIPLLTFNDGPLVVVEGFKACMWVHQAGIHEVVATIGSGLTDEQCTILSRLGRRVVLMFDGDKAGFSGTLIAGRKLSRSFPVRVADVPYGKQPDHMPPDEVVGAVQSAEPFELWATRTRSDKQWLNKILSSYKAT